MDINPRLNGYNYGVGWGPTAKPPIYAEAQELALHLNRLANEATKTAWALEMAIRDVRLAETETEKRRAVAMLAFETAKHRSKQTQAA